MRDQFIAAIDKNQAAFGLDLDDRRKVLLADHYEIVMEHNPLLHLVGPCTPEEFAVRHVLESLTLLEFLPFNAGLADIGPGAGFPSIPCLLVSDELRGLLIESKEKKARYLEEAVQRLGLSDRVRVVNRQFKETRPEGVGYITCRALDRFSENLGTLIKWSNGKKLLFFGGRDMGDKLQERGIKFVQKLLPLSEQRYLYISNK